MESSFSRKAINTSTIRSESLNLKDKLRSIINFAKSQGQSQKAYPNFDWRFYVEYYEDLSDLSNYEEAYEHWIIFGQIEERFSNQDALEQYFGQKKAELPEDFDYQGYLEANVDLQEKFAANPYKKYKAIEHFLQHGRYESRPYTHTCFYGHEQSGFLNEECSETRTENFHLRYSDVDFLTLFDVSYYLEHNPDVAEAGVNPLVHFIRSGAAEGRDPHPLFDVSYYLEHNPDVAEAGVNPLVHFIRSGAAEGRDPHPLFDVSYYLEHNPDVAEAGVNPLVHFIRSGAAEGRKSNGLFQPLISLVLVVQDGSAKLLTNLLSSISKQIYSNWQLCIVATGLVDLPLQKFLELYASENSKVRITYTKERLGANQTFQQALSLAEGLFVVLPSLNSLMHEEALLKAVFKINQDPDADLIYVDDNYIDETGQTLGSFYKPNWSPDLMHCQNYIGHFSILRRAVLNEINDLQEPDDEKYIYDLLLKVCERTSRIFHIPEILCSYIRSGTSTSSCFLNSHSDFSKIIQNHLNRQYGLGKAQVVPSSCCPGTFNVRFTVQEQPLVSIIIPTRDKIELLKACVESILEKTDYANYEILILNNNSVEKSTFKWFAEIQSCKHIRIISANYHFNYSRLNNHGIREAQGDIFIFLNNDTEVITSDWITGLVADASRDEIGIVGPLLLYPDQTIQHAGVVVGLGYWADHIFKGMKPENTDLVYVPPVVKRNVLAVTGACMAISRKTIEQIGMFDESATVCGTDVEICIRAYNLGLRNLYNPHVRLYHYESKTRDVTNVPAEDFKFSEVKYKKFWKQGDPYYNVNLSLSSLIPREEKEAAVKIKRSQLKLASCQSSGLNQEGKKLLSNAQIPETTPFNIYKSSKNRFRLNLLLPSINQKEFFGGLATAVEFFEKFIDLLGDRCDFRIILTDSTPNAEALNRFKDYELVQLDEESKVRLQIVVANNRFARKLAVRRDDYFIATAWWTAHIAQKMIVEQATLFPNIIYKLIYLIQDFEPGFYAWSQRYQLALNTYNAAIPTIAVFNTSILKDFFNSQGFRFDSTFHFEPKLRAELRNHLEQGNSRQKRILIYGRPSVERNAFPIIIEALKIWCRAEPTNTDWEIVSMGEFHPDLPITPEVTIRSVGKMSLSDYASLLNQSAVGISLMISPHPSYPPLEMAHFGLLTVTNNYGNKDLSTLHENITSVDKLDAESVARALALVTSKFQINPLIGSRGKSYFNDFLNNSNPFYFMNEILQQLPNGCRIAN